MSYKNIKKTKKNAVNFVMKNQNEQLMLEDKSYFAMKADLNCIQDGKFHSMNQKKNIFLFYTVSENQ